MFEGPGVGSGSVVPGLFTSMGLGGGGIFSLAGLGTLEGVVGGSTGKKIP